MANSTCKESGGLPSPIKEEPCPNFRTGVSSEDPSPLVHTHQHLVLRKTNSDGSAAAAGYGSGSECGSEGETGGGGCGSGGGGGGGGLPRRSSLRKEANRASKKTKSVSFHSATSLPTERKVATAMDCLHYMITGSSLLKVRSNARQYHRYFTLDEDLRAIRWTPTSKKTNKALLPIDVIREIRTGKNTDVFRNKEIAGGYSEECSFSIIYGDSFDCLDLVAATSDEANIWVTGLNALIGASKSPDGLDDRQHLRDRWLKGMFEQADTDNSGCLDESEAIALMKKLNSQVTTERVKQKIAELEALRADGNRGRIGIKEFIDMFKEISTRPEVYFLLIRHSNKDYLTAEDLQLFLEGEQGMSGVTIDKCQQIIDAYEPSGEARDNGQMLIDGFNRYLLSEECDIFNPSHLSPCEDMSQPITHYFISTSHNTYLLEDQLKGPSSSDGYRLALEKGCRCIKVDCWDSPEEPVVYHGHTLTSKVHLTEVLTVIRQYAFQTSEYPLIIHLENHCSLPQQKIVAEKLREIFEENLYVHPVNSPQHVGEMSPEELKHKVLIKGRKLSTTSNDDGVVSDEDEGGGESSNVSKKKDSHKRIPLSQELSDLVSVSRARFVDFGTSHSKHTPTESFSLSESTASKLVHGCPEDFVNHNKQYLTRIFPNSSRIDSSNYNPQDFWNCGCQMVALNFQTTGQMLDLYLGKFRENGACGYVLKPSVMREPVSLFSANTKGSIPGVPPQILRLKIISGQQLPRPRGSTAKGDAIDPYVLIQIFGIPADRTELQTRTVSNEGNSPVFEETFEFEINLPDLALVRFVVLDDEFIGDDFIGQATIPFHCLQTGYRHVTLYAANGEVLENATLFVHVVITNKRGYDRKAPKKMSHSDIRNVGIRNIDDNMKSTTQCLADSCAARSAVDGAMNELRTECGLGESSNVKQCLRVLITRLATNSEPVNINIIDSDGYPEMQINHPVSSALARVVMLFDKALREFRNVLDTSESQHRQLKKAYKWLLDQYEDLNSLCIQAGLKGKKLNKALENYAWNVRILRGQLDLLDNCRKECKQAVLQVQSSAATINSTTYRNIKAERSPTLPRDRPRLLLRDGATPGSQTPTSGSASPMTSPYFFGGSSPGIPRSPTSPFPCSGSAPPGSPMDNRPRGILKNKNSSPSFDNFLRPPPNNTMASSPDLSDSGEVFLPTTRSASPSPVPSPSKEAAKRQQSSPS